MEGVSPYLSITFHFGIISGLNSFGLMWCNGMLLNWNVSYFYISTARILGRVWVRIKEYDKKGTWKCMNKNKEYDLHDRYDLWTHISSMGNYKWRFRENHEFSSSVWNRVSSMVLVLELLFCCFVSVLVHFVLIGVSFYVVACCVGFMHFGILLELYNLFEDNN